MHINRKTKGSLMLLAGAMIWGGAFIAQSAGMNYIRPFTYSAIRFYIGALVLVPVALIFSKNITKSTFIRSAVGGSICGFFLFLGNSFQQYGLVYTAPGKAGFISALYLMFVPIIAYFIFGKKIEKHIWLGIIIAIIGFYFLCVHGEFNIQPGDLMILMCAFCFSFQILGVDYFASKNINSIIMAIFQFLSCAVISTVFMFIFDEVNISAIIDAKWTILYSGVLSSGVAYTLQIVGQKDVESSVASLIMSLESVFAALSELLILHTTMNPVELFGCLLVFSAVLIVQKPKKKEV